MIFVCIFHHFDAFAADFFFRAAFFRFFFDLFYFRFLFAIRFIRLIFAPPALRFRRRATPTPDYAAMSHDVDVTDFLLIFRRHASSLRY